MNELSALILDDDLDNISILKLYITKYYKSITTIHAATNNDDAVALYLQYQPNILLLDIELQNGTNSFSMLERISDENAEIIFISSHRDYALKALNDINTTAYLTKPYKPEQLVVALDKAVKNLNEKQSNCDLIPPRSHQNLIAVSLIDKVELIEPNNIVYLEADGRYTSIYLENSNSVLSSKNLGEYESQLDPNIFFRIHHKYIVNIKMVTKINKLTGNYCEFLNHKSIPIAKRRLPLLNKFLKL